MKKETSFLIVSIFWMLLFNILVINFFIGNGTLSTGVLATGAVVAPPEDTSFIPGDALKIAAPLLILNFIILVLLIIGYEKWVKEKKESI